MANKYIDKSATFNGDGTASNQAASAGAVGAWNSLANCLNGVPGYGSIANGDNIYIRTKASGANLSETKTDANITTAARTAALPVNWIFDDGTVWPGDAGVFTLTTAVTTTGRTWTLGDYNNVIAKAWNFVLNAPFTGSLLSVFSPASCYIKDLKITGSTGALQILTTPGLCVMENIYFNPGGAYNSIYPMRLGNSSTLRMINPVFDLSLFPSSGTEYGLFQPGAYGNFIEIIGGYTIGASQNQYLVGFTVQPITYIFNGFDYGLMQTDPSSAKPFGYTHDVNTLDISNKTALFDMVRNTPQGKIDWTPGANYPYGNAVLPDSANTSWSYKVFSRASQSLPLSFPVLEEVYTATAATKTITANLLINNNLASPQKDEWWMTVSYVNNATGKRVSETTRASGVLDTATGVWNSTVYGAQNYTQYKIALTTANAIKQYTSILVTLFTSRPAVLSTDFYFVDPEVVIV